MIVLALLAASPLQDHSAVFPGGPEAEPPAGARGCAASDDEVTICGDRDQSAFRIRPLPDRYRDQPLRPGFDLPGGGRGKVRAVQRAVGGVSVPAAMVTLRIPLGGKPEAEDEAAPQDK